MGGKGTIGTMWAWSVAGTPRVRRIRATMHDWFALRRSRQALLRLDEHLLRDIGITRADALAEARRSDLTES